MTASIIKCPACGRYNTAEPFDKPYDSDDMLVAVFFGFLGWIAAATSRRSWLRCTACKYEFHRPTSGLVKWLMWIVILIVLTLATYFILNAAAADEPASDLPVWLQRVSGEVHAHPVAALGAACAATSMMLFTIFVLGLKLGRMRRSERNRIAELIAEDKTI